MRLCPNCKVALHKKRYKGVGVEECQNCHGIFFDKGELDQAKNNADSDVRWLDFVLFSLSDANKIAREEKDCPTCSIAMTPFEYASSKVIINRCPSCSGVWLDNTEFKKIISYLDNLVVHQSSQALAEHMKTQLAEIMIGPKSEVEELKDFMAVTRLFEERWSAEHPNVTKLLEIYYDLTPFK